MNRQASPDFQHKVSNRISDPSLPPRSESFSSGGIQQARTPPMHRSVEPQVRLPPLLLLLLFLDLYERRWLCLCGSIGTPGTFPEMTPFLPVVLEMQMFISFMSIGKNTKTVWWFKPLDDIMRCGRRNFQISGDDLFCFSSGSPLAL